MFFSEFGLPPLEPNLVKRGEEGTPQLPMRGACQLGPVIFIDSKRHSLIVQRVEVRITDSKSNKWFSLWCKLGSTKTTNLGYSNSIQREEGSPFGERAWSEQLSRHRPAWSTFLSFHSWRRCRAALVAAAGMQGQQRTEEPCEISRKRTWLWWNPNYLKPGD